MKTQEARPGDPATRRPGDPATRRPGDPATRRPGDPATRRPGDPATRRPGDPATRRPGIIPTGVPSALVKPCAKHFFARPTMAATAAPSARIACRPSLKMVIAISPNLSPGLPVRTARTSAERRLFRLAYRMPNRARKQLRARVCATRRAAVPSPATTMLRARPSDPMHAMPRGRADSADRFAPEPAPVPVTGDRRTCPGIPVPGFAQTPRRLHHGKRPCERPRHRG